MKRITARVIGALAALILLLSAPANAAPILYGVDGPAGILMTIDTATGAGTAVGSLGFENVVGLAYDSSTDTLFGVAVSNDTLFDGAAWSGQLISIDRTTGAGSSVGLYGFFIVSSLAYDSSTNTLFGVEPSTQELVTIDTTTGAGTVVGSVGTNIVGLAYDSSTDTLFGVDTIEDQLFTIDTTTSATTPVGPLGFFAVAGLAYDSSTDMLFGVDFSSQQLITIDRITGAATAVGPVGLCCTTALEFVPEIVPIPAAVWLFGSALGLLGWMRRKVA